MESRDVLKTGFQVSPHRTVYSRFTVSQGEISLWCCVRRFKRRHCGYTAFNVLGKILCWVNSQHNYFGHTTIQSECMSLMCYNACLTPRNVFHADPFIDYHTQVETRLIQAWVQTQRDAILHTFLVQKSRHFNRHLLSAISADSETSGLAGKWNLTLLGPCTISKTKYQWGSSTFQC